MKLGRTDRERIRRADREHERIVSLIAMRRGVSIDELRARGRQIEERVERAGRTCGECQMCCVMPAIAGTGSEAGSPCKFQGQRGQPGCLIYPQRPIECREYECLWRRGEIDEARRPDVLGALPRGDVTRDGVEYVKFEVAKRRSLSERQLAMIAAEMRSLAERGVGFGFAFCGEAGAECFLDSPITDAAFARAIDSLGMEEARA